jgi:cell division protein FtsA
MRFPWQAQSTPTALALDVGTEFVKALVFEVVEGHAIVTGHGKERQRLADMHGGQVTDIGGVIETASKAIDRAVAESNAEPTQVILGIAGELVKGTTTTTVLKRQNSRAPITHRELTELIGEAQKRVLEQSKEELSWETGHSGVEVELVSSAVVGIEIDGHRVTNAVGFEGGRVAVSIYTAYAPRVHVSALERIADGLNLNLLLIATEPYAVARCFGSDESSEVSSIFIDVGGGTTDIAVVRSGGLEGTKMVALGGRVFTKRIAATNKIPFHEAEQLKLAFANGTLPAREEKAVQAMLDIDAEVWLSGVQLALEEFGSSERFHDNPLLPHRIYLCGGGSLLPNLRAQLDTDWWKGLPFAQVPEISYITPEQVSQVIDRTNSLHTTQDVTPMGLASLGLDVISPNQTTKRNPLSNFIRTLRT